MWPAAEKIHLWFAANGALNYRAILRNQLLWARGLVYMLDRSRGQRVFSPTREFFDEMQQKYPPPTSQSSPRSRRARSANASESTSPA